MADSSMDNSLDRLYGSSLALLTDLYELTMAYGYWKHGMTGTDAMFVLFFREQPFNGGYSVACGLKQVIDYISSFKFDESDLDYLGSLTATDGSPLFEQAFLDYLGGIHFNCDVDAVPEGTVVFPHEPILRIRGPLIQCQIFETALLNILNFQTLIATKAARVCEAAEGGAVLEFGLRRAQGIDGGIMASRAAYIGGCAGTSNVLAGKLYDIPVRGTHAHSWIMAFDTEPEAFAAYADAMPHNTIFLVDTYDTLQGVRNAIAAGHALEAKGHRLAGIRLDSGDLADLSKKARLMLDDAGFSDTTIVGSSDLDEYRIARLKKEGAPIALWGVGTKLVTGWDSPALSGVYKLSAVRRPGASWEYKMKVSDEVYKSTVPGMLQVRRYESGGRFLYDVIYNEDSGIGPDAEMVDIHDWNTRTQVSRDAQNHDLLVPVFRGGDCVYDYSGIHESRNNTQRQLYSLDKGIRQLDGPRKYRIGVESQLFMLREKLLAEHSNHEHGS